MNNNTVQFRLDTIVGNVKDLERVLSKFRGLFNLKFFMRFKIKENRGEIYE